MTRKKKLILAVLSAVALTALVVVSNVVRRNSPLRNLKVVVTYDALSGRKTDDQKQNKELDLARRPDTLVSAESLRQQLLSLDPALLSGKVKETDLRHPEALAMRNPYVESAKASVNVRGDLVLKVVQRTPVARLMSDKGECYLSHDGKAMPLSREGEADVLVVNGRVSAKHPGPLLPLAVWLYDHPLYGCLFDQASLRPDGDIVLAPKLGDHLVVLGGLDSLERRMDDLLVFYRKGLSEVGWNTYKEINLKYNGQIVCR